LQFLENLEAWSFRLFGKAAPSLLKNGFKFEGYLERSKIKIYPETYVSLMLLMATLTIPVSVAGLVIVLFTGFLPLLFLIPMPLFVVIGCPLLQRTSALWLQEA
jgi:hypothetical protein